MIPTDRIKDSITRLDRAEIVFMLMPALLRELDEAKR
jgi:hypothetical protein